MADSSFFDKATDYATNYALGGVSGAALTGISDIIGKLSQNKLFEHLKMQDVGKYYTPLGSILYWEEVYGLVKNINKQLGIGGQMSMQIEDAAVEAFTKTIQYGGDMQDVMASFDALTQSYRRNLTLTGDELDKLTQFRVAFGEGFEQIFAINKQLGLSISDSYDLLNNVYETSDAYGVNVRNVLRDIDKNLQALNRYSFRRGTQALSDMALNAEKTKISIESALSLTDKLLNPEDAIEFAAQVQMLGGEFAKIADPFQLIFMARNEPDALQQQIAGVTKNLATLNKATGEIDIDALGFSQLREFSKIAGININELTESARELYKQDAIRNLFSVDLRTKNDFDDIVSKVAGLVEYNKQLDTFGLAVDGQFKSVAELNEEDLNKLSTLGENEEERFRSLIDSNRSLEDTLTILIKTIQANLIGDDLYRNVDRQLKSSVQNVDDQILNTDAFESAKRGYNALQEDFFDRFSPIVQSALKMDLDGINEQISDNIFTGPTQMQDVLKEMNINTDLNGEGLFKKMDISIESHINTLGKLQEFINDTKTFIEKIDYYNEKITKGISKYSPIDISGWSDWFGIFESAKDKYDDNSEIINKEIKEFKETINKTNEKQNNLNTNIKGDIGGTINLNIGDKQIEQIILGDGNLKNELLSLIEPQIQEMIRKNKQKMYQDFENNSNLPTRNIG